MPTASSRLQPRPDSKKLQDRIAADVERLQPRTRTPRAHAGRARHDLGQRARSAPVARIGAVADRRAIARVRQIAPERIRAIVDAHIEGRDLGVLGEPRVNVLVLNIALDRQLGQPPEPPPAPSGSSSAGSAPGAVAGSAQPAKP